MARWETNVADIQLPVRYGMDEEERESARHAYEITRILGCLDEVVLACCRFLSSKQMNLNRLQKNLSVRRLSDRAHRGFNMVK